MKRVTVVYHSGYGHTEEQAQAVAAGIDSLDGVSVRPIAISPGSSRNSLTRQARAGSLGSSAGLLAQSPAVASPEEAPPAGDLATATEFGRRIADVTKEVRG